MQRTFLLLILFLGVLGCDPVTRCMVDCDPTSQDPIKLSKNSIQNDSKIKILDALNETQLPSDPARIQSVSLSGHQLTLNVSTGGGCRIHTWGLVGTPAIAKSLPPQNTIRLTHDADGDACEALLHETLTFDLSPLADVLKPTQEVILHLALPDGQNMYVSEKTIVFHP